MDKETYELLEAMLNYLLQPPQYYDPSKLKILVNQALTFREKFKHLSS